MAIGDKLVQFMGAATLKLIQRGMRAEWDMGHRPECIRVRARLFRDGKVRAVEQTTLLVEIETINVDCAEWGYRLGERMVRDLEADPDDAHSK